MNRTGGWSLRKVSPTIVLSSRTVSDSWRSYMTEQLRFDWDPAKREMNLDKHGLDFRRAIEVFKDPQHVDEDTTRPEHGEVRRKAVDRVEQVMISVIYTDRNGVRRIISARRARRDEREQYRQSAETA